MSATFEAYLGAMEALRLAQDEMLKAIDAELQRQKVSLTALQAIVLYQLGGQELSPTAIRAGGFYLGTNFDYTKNKLIEGGYLTIKPNSEDRRQVRLRASPQGLAVAAILHQLFHQHAEALVKLGDPKGQSLNLVATGLRNLTRFWSDDRCFRISGMAA